MKIRLEPKNNQAVKIRGLKCFNWTHGKCLQRDKKYIFGFYNTAFPNSLRIEFFTDDFIGLVSFYDIQEKVVQKLDHQEIEELKIENDEYGKEIFESIVESILILKASNKHL